jgi:hypothetical protein
VANASSARDQRLYRYAKRLGGYLEKLHRPPEPLYEGEVRLEGGRWVATEKFRPVPPEPPVNPPDGFWRTGETGPPWIDGPPMDETPR